MRLIEKGFFIAIDGIDGCGKTTQINILKKSYSEYNPLITKEPGGTEVGKVLRHILISKEFDCEPETELILYCADRLEHQKKVILPALSKKRLILCDRFLSSTYAYQVFGRGLDKKILDELVKLTVFKWPDLTFIIDIKPEIALERAIKRLKREKKLSLEGKFEESGIEFFEKVREGFLWYGKNFDNVVVLDGSRNIDEISEQIKNLIEELINVCGT